MKKNKFLNIVLGSLMALAFLSCAEETATQTKTEWPELQALLAENLFNPPPQPLGPDQVPPISTVTLEGQDVELSSLRGKVVALNFWATWCGPCRAEMPSMQELQNRYEDQGFTFVAVNLQESQEEVMAFKKDLGFDFPVWMDPTGVIAGEYGIQSIPTTYLINGKGEVVGRIIGSIDWTEEGVVQVVETLLSNLEA